MFFRSDIFHNTFDRGIYWFLLRSGESVTCHSPIFHRPAEDSATGTSSYSLCNSTSQFYIGDSLCNTYHNNEECSYDGGDCCECETADGTRCNYVCHVVVGPVVPKNSLGFLVYTRYHSFLWGLAKLDVKFQTLKTIHTCFPRTYERHASGRLDLAKGSVTVSQNKKNMGTILKCYIKQNKKVLW